MPIAVSYIIIQSEMYIHIFFRRFLYLAKVKVLARISIVGVWLRLDVNASLCPAYPGYGIDGCQGSCPNLGLNGQDFHMNVALNFILGKNPQPIIEMSTPHLLYLNVLVDPRHTTNWPSRNADKFNWRLLHNHSKNRLKFSKR